MKTELKKLVIEVAGKKLELSPAEAKELKSILADLFGADTATHVHYYDHHWWNRTFYYPTYCGSGISQSATITSGCWDGTVAANSGTYTLTASG
jgi:hypothetical protein